MLFCVIGIAFVMFMTSTFVEDRGDEDYFHSKVSEKRRWTEACLKDA